MKRLSIRDILLLTISALTLVIALLVASEVYQQWERLEKINTLKTATLTSDPLFDVMERLSVERDMAYSLLYTDDPVFSQALYPRLESSRKEVNVLIPTLQDLSVYNFPMLEDKIRLCRMQFNELKKIRLEIDAALLLPLGKRDPSLASRWFDQVTALTLQTDNVWLEFIKHFREVDPVVSLQMRFKYDLRAIMENSGRGRALIGRLIVQNADASPQERAKLLRWQGAVDEAWLAADSLAEQGNLYPAITLAFKEAKSHYDNVYGMVQDIFYVPGTRHGAHYPFAADFWFELSEETNDSFYELKNAAIKETHAYLNVLEAKARQVILWHAVLLVLTVMLCLYSFRVIIYRVIRPINMIVEALITASEGKMVSFTLPVWQQDEIGKLVQVLHTFQRNTGLLSAIVASSDDAIISKNLEGIITSWNTSAKRLLGYSAAEAIGKHVSLIIPPEHLKEEQFIIDRISQGHSIDHLETIRMAKDGRHIDVTLTVSPIRDAGGAIVGASKIIRDITERKKAEIELLNYTHALERSNKELDDFAYIASHDLKEPLRGIHNHSRFLLEDNEDKLDEESVKKLNRLVYLSQRMERLVNDLLYFSRLGRQELAIQQTDINEVIHDIENTLDHFLAEHKARIHIPKTLPTITCDKTRITELFRNLITNAVKYNDRPERMVEIGFLPTRASPQGVAYANVFYVKDDGKGIAPEFHEEIFRIFKRLQSSTGVEDGTGVGLTFVKKIVERHGGKIWLESEPGQGTIFYFTLEGSGNESAKPL